VAYATPKRQLVLPLYVPRGCTVAEAIERSAIREEFPGLVVDFDAVGIFGRKAPAGQVLEPGDRVEIYRPLIADPREARRERARDGKKRPKKGEKPGQG
jgi:putative ubiquitin-RnfH superfamily antitoxin RatB of RatAB toxin-antitoxin module